MGFDDSNNLWLFGGVGYDDSSGKLIQNGALNTDINNVIATADTNLGDLWSFNGSMWTFQHNGADVSGNYSNKGVPDEYVYPAHRGFGGLWFDNNSVLHIFGGITTSMVLGDIWSFNDSMWTWINGTYSLSVTTDFAPGGRYGFGYDSHLGDFYMYGGRGYDFYSVPLMQNDELWKYNASGWTLLKGNISESNSANYSITKGVPCPECTPGDRELCFLKVMNDSTVCVGFGLYDTSELSDLWCFDGSSWTWVAGYEFSDDSGSFYLESGLADVDEQMFPRKRVGALTWVDERDTIWIFGGKTGSKYYSDLWVLPSCKVFAEDYHGNPTDSITFYNSDKTTSRICGAVSVLSENCTSLEKAYALAAVCDVPEIHIRETVGSSERVLNSFTIIGKNVTIIGYKGNSTLKMYDSFDNTQLKIRQNMGSVTFVGIDFVMQGHFNHFDLDGCIAFFKDCTFTIGGLVSTATTDAVVQISNDAIVNISDWKLVTDTPWIGEPIISVENSVLDVKNGLVENALGSDFFEGNDRALLVFNNLTMLNTYGELMYISLTSSVEMYGCNFTNTTADTTLISIVDDSSVIFEESYVAHSTNLFKVLDQSVLTIGNSVFQDIFGKSGLVIEISSNSQSEIIDSFFLNIRADELGGVAYSSASNLTFGRCNFQNISSSDGAIVAAQLHSHVNIWNSRVESMVVESGCIASIVFFSELSIYNVSLSKCNASSGGIFFLDRESIVTAVELNVSDVVVDRGGLAYVSRSSILKLSNSNLSRMEAKSEGGVIYVLKTSSVTSVDNIYFLNSAALDGGVFYVEGILTSSGDIFTKSNANGNGGVGYSFGGNVYVEDSVLVTENNAESSGGFIFSSGGVLNVTRTNISYCSANGGSGGAITVTKSCVLKLESVSIEYCYASLSGGGIQLSSNNAILRSVQIGFCESLYGVGGGLLLDTSQYDYTEITISDSSFSDNNAMYGGGVFSHGNTAPMIENGIFTNNHASVGGGGVFSNGVLLATTFSTFTFNSADGYGADAASAVCSMYATTVFNASSVLDYIPLCISLFDCYSNAVVDFMSKEISLSSDNLVLLGQTKLGGMEGGSCTEDLRVNALPGTSGTLKAVFRDSDSYGDYASIPPFVEDLLITVNVQTCENNEIVYLNTCSNCPQGQYVVTGEARCGVCPEYATCLGKFVEAFEGYWGPSQEGEIALYKCPLENGCPGGQEFTKCNHGYDGVLCASCIGGYGQAGKECVKCANTIYYLIVYPVLIVFVVTLLILASLFFSRKKNNITSGAGAKILFNYIQTVSILAGLVTLKYQQLGSESLLGLFSAFTLNFSALSIDCIVPFNFYSGLLILFVISLLLATLPLLLWAPFFVVSAIVTTVGWILELKAEGNLMQIGLRIRKYGFNLIGFLGRYRNAFAILVHGLLLPRITGQVMALFSCSSVGGKEYLTADYSIECWDDNHVLSIILGMMFFVMFVFGSQMLLLICMTVKILIETQLYVRVTEHDKLEEAKASKGKTEWFQMKWLDKTNEYYEQLPVRLVKDVQNAAERRPRNKIAKYLLGALQIIEVESALDYYQRGYKRVFFFWEFVIATRKAMLLTALVFFADTSMKSLLALMILSGFSIAQVMASPFKRKADNNAELSSMFPCIWIASGVLLHEMYATNTDTYARDVLLLFILVVLVVVPVACYIMASFVFSGVSFHYHGIFGLKESEEKAEKPLSEIPMKERSNLENGEFTSESSSEFTSESSSEYTSEIDTSDPEEDTIISMTEKK